jgi:rubrerythrin
MTKEQALNYLKSSGFSKEQIQAIVEALSSSDNLSSELAKNSKKLEKGTAKNNLGVDEVTALAEWIKKLTKECEEAYNKGYADGMKEQEPKKGYWLRRPHVYGVTYCSMCDFELKIDNTNYCPNCGAKMEDV